LVDLSFSGLRAAAAATVTVCPRAVQWLFIR
jgi:hypothetical protein